MTRAEFDRLCELQRWIIFAVCVANKTEAHARRVTIALCTKNCSVTPFQYLVALDKLGELENELRQLHSGQYTRIARCLRELATGNIDLETCTPADLEVIHGIGPKTSRYFIMETRPGVQFAALDTHILKWLRSQGYDAPKSTPSKKKYAELETVFLAEAAKRGKTPRELDLEVWSMYAVSQQS